MIRLDGTNGKITCPIGDTGLLLVSLKLKDNAPPLPDGTVIEFKICGDKTVEPILIKVSTLADSAAAIWLSSEDTLKLPKSGSYRWNVRVVTDPVMQADGSVVARQQSAEVHSPFAFGGALPTFEAKFVP